MYFAGTNPFHRHQQINRIIEGWRKLKAVIAIDNQWTSTCRFADNMLPATTQFERNDLDQYGNHSNRGIIAMGKQVVPPAVRRNAVRRLRTFTEGLDEMGWLKEHLAEKVYNKARTRRSSAKRFDDFWNNKEASSLTIRECLFATEAFRESGSRTAGHAEMA